MKVLAACSWMLTAPLSGAGIVAGLTPGGTIWPSTKKGSDLLSGTTRGSREGTVDVDRRPSLMQEDYEQFTEVSRTP